MRQEQEMKGIQIGKKEVRLSLLTDEMLLYQKDAKNSNTTKILLEITNTFGKIEE
jgi:hypothetical protein